MNNADSLACVVQLFTKATDTDLEARARHTRGEDLALRQNPPGPIALSAPEDKPKFELVGYSEIGVRGIRWVLTDDAGRRYLLRRGSEIIDPMDFVDWVGEIIIGSKTRELLRARGITSAHLSAIVAIPEVGEGDRKVIKLDLTLQP